MSDESQATISASLGGLEVEVSGDDMAEAEEAFERVWEKRLEEAGTMTEALRERLVGVQ